MYSFDEIANFDPEIAQAMTDEINRQDHNIELIASENIVSKAVMAGKYSDQQICRRVSGKALLWRM